MRLEYDETGKEKNRLVNEWLFYNCSSLYLAYKMGAIDYMEYHHHWIRDELDFPFKSE